MPCTFVPPLVRFRTRLCLDSHLGHLLHLSVPALVYVSALPAHLLLACSARVIAHFLLRFWSDPWKQNEKNVRSCLRCHMISALIVNVSVYTHLEWIYTHEKTYSNRISLPPLFPFPPFILKGTYHFFCFRFPSIRLTGSTMYFCSSEKAVITPVDVFHIPDEWESRVLGTNIHSGTVVLRRMDANPNQQCFMRHCNAICLLPTPSRDAEVCVDEPTGHCFSEILPPSVLLDAAGASTSCYLEIDEYVTCKQWPDYNKGLKKLKKPLTQPLKNLERKF